MRCLYVDLDATLLGPRGAVTRDGDGRFTLLGLRALEACHRAGALVGAMSGRPRATLESVVRVLGIDDYVFLRPTQSEAVMLQFGDLQVVRGGQIVDRWPVFTQ